MAGWGDGGTLAEDELLELLDELLLDELLDETEVDELLLDDEEDVLLEDELDDDEEELLDELLTEVLEDELLLELEVEELLLDEELLELDEEDELLLLEDDDDELEEDEPPSVYSITNCGLRPAVAALDECQKRLTSPICPMDNGKVLPNTEATLAAFRLAPTVKSAVASVSMLEAG